MLRNCQPNRKWLEVATSGHRTECKSLTDGKILYEYKQHFIAQNHSYSPFHHPNMDEILLKRMYSNQVIHPSILFAEIVLYTYIVIPRESPRRVHGESLSFLSGAS